MKKVRGFTFVEVLVVVSVIAILSTIVLAGMNESRKLSRDAERKSDLKLLQAAVERYKNDNGRYPPRCPTLNPASPWSGQIGTNYACADGSNQYITGLAPKYIPVLPNDDQLNETDSGYVYVTNTAGTVYKIEARKTVEKDFPFVDHEFESCDVSNSAPIDCTESTQPPDGNAPGKCDVAICDRVMPSRSKPNHCSGAIFQTSYAVWGGFAGSVGDTPATVARLTEDIICEIP